MANLDSTWRGRSFLFRGKKWKIYKVRSAKDGYNDYVEAWDDKGVVEYFSYGTVEDGWELLQQQIESGAE